MNEFAILIDRQWHVAKKVSSAAYNLSGPSRQVWSDPVTTGMIADVGKEVVSIDLSRFVTPRGTLTNRDRALEMARRNIAPADIALALGLSPGTVHGYLSIARREGQDIPYFTWNNGRSNVGVVATMSKDTAKRLLPDANARKLSTERLAARLLETIAEEGMVDAILDDEVARHG